MKHLGTVPLETERLSLRRFRIEDSQALFDRWGSDPEVTRFLMWLPFTTVEAARSVVSRWIESYSDPGFYQWAIVPKGSGDMPVGAIGVVRKDEDIDMVHIGYCIGRPWWHRGITAEAFMGIIPFLIEQVGVNRIESRHDPRNPNSGRVMLKCGLRYEGTLRQADRNNQGICDAAMYALLAGDRRDRE